MSGEQSQPETIKLENLCPLKLKPETRINDLEACDLCYLETRTEDRPLPGLH